MAIEHRFVHGLHSGATAEYLSQPSKRLEPLHVAQGQLDALCGLCGLGMAAMLLLGVSRSQVLGLSRANRGPLAAVWSRASDFAFTGADAKDLVAWATELNAGLQCRVLRPTPQRLGMEVALSVEAGAVPLLEFQSGSWLHWSPVIGYERADGGSPAALLMLDPSRAAPQLTCFNGRLDLQSGTSSRYPLAYRTPGRSPIRVRARSLLLIARAPPR